MPIYIISGGSKEKRDKEIKKIYGLEKPAGNFENDPDFQKIVSSESLTVENIKDFESLLYLKPYQEGPKVYLIEPFDRLTFEAQNLLAKLLNQIKDTVVVLAGENEELLSTQISENAKKVILPKEIGNLATKDEEQEGERLFEKIIKSDPGQRLRLVSFIESREEAERFCQIQIFILRKKLLESPNKKILLNIAAIQKTLKYLKANVNFKLAIENLVLYLH